MVDVLEFVFRDGWTFCGTLVLIAVIGLAFAAAFSELPRGK